jgi:hypothetical protein
MPDPQKDLAAIVEPAMPPAPPPQADWAGPLALAGALVLLALFAAWRWRARAPLRELRRLATDPDPPRAAHALARLVRARADQPDAAWQRDLERLRFASPASDAGATLARLCREAEAWLRRY